MNNRKMNSESREQDGCRRMQSGVLTLCWRHSWMLMWSQQCIWAHAHLTKRGSCPTRNHCEASALLRWYIMLSLYFSTPPCQKNKRNPQKKVQSLQNWLFLWVTSYWDNPSEPAPCSLPIVCFSWPKLGLLILFLRGQNMDSNAWDTEIPLSKAGWQQSSCLGNNFHATCKVAKSSNFVVPYWSSPPGFCS